MKKYLITFLTLILFISPVYASTNTYTRTETDLRVKDDVNVTSSNKSIILNTPSVDATEKVYDFADLFTYSEESELYTYITKFIETYNMDLAVVTINTNNKYSEVEYADDFYDYNDFGVGSKKDGLLFLIDMDNRKFYISTTGEAIRMYDDARIDGMLDYIEDYMINGNYYEAAYSLVSKAANYAENGIPSSNKNSYIGENGDIFYVKKVNWFVPFIISSIITLITMLVLINKNKMIKKAQNARSYINNNSANITQRNDQFLTTHTTSVSLQSSSSGGGGSSTHSSSSGSSHGGGGRSF